MIHQLICECGNSYCCKNPRRCRCGRELEVPITRTVSIKTLDQILSECAVAISDARGSYWKLPAGGIITQGMLKYLGSTITLKRLRIEGYQFTQGMFNS